MNQPAFQLNIDVNDIAILLFDLPGERVNKFTLEVLDELEGIIDQLDLRNDIKALILKSGKRDVFIAGADLKSFAPAFKDPKLLDRLIRSGHRVFNKIEKLPFPTIAVIDGVCLGGGLECALAFKYRIVTDNPKTSLGLPEVTLGIIPGWGGTQRLPRCVGLMQGLEMILSGKPVNGSKAIKIHLAVAYISATFLEEQLQEFLQKALSSNGKQSSIAKQNQSSLKSLLLEKNFLGRKLLFSKARRQLYKKTKGHYLAPEVALKLIEETNQLPLREGLDKEIGTFLGNVNTGLSQAMNLIGLFFIQESLKKDAGKEISDKPLSIKSVAVLGAGTMGAGIAWLFSNNNYSVRLKDLDWDLVGKGFATVHKMFGESVKYKKLTSSQRDLKFSLLSGTTDYRGFKNVDLVVEAATEDLKLKHRIFQELEQNLSPDSIIVSNTSSLSISEMANCLEHPERFLGLHFFNPVNRMPLVEVIPGEKTSEIALATAVDLCRKIGKTPIIVADCAGFLVNRIFMCGANEVMWMFQEGISMQQIEKVLLDFGMPISPFLLADEVGNDVSYKVAQTLEKAYGERMHCPEIMQLIDEKEFYGKKNGKGFYMYHKGDAIPNPEILRLLSTMKPITHEITDRDIKDRMVLTMVNEASRCLKENVVASAGYLDMAMILGTGFPPFRGGVLKYADQLGIEYVVAQLKYYESTYGPRFTPSDKLLSMKTSKESFY